MSLLAEGVLTVADCVPEMAEVTGACARVAELSGGYFSLAPAGRFDPTGYVKGWAVERGDDPVRRRVGQSPGQRRRRRAVRGRAGGAARRHPAPPRGCSRGGWASPTRSGPGHLALVVDVTDGGVATSGTAERGAHIIDPHTARPAAGLASLTVTGPSLTLADAFATAAFAMGAGRARAWTESLDGYDAYAITDTGQTWQTSGFGARAAPA